MIAVYGDVHASRSFTTTEIQHPGTGPAAGVVVQGAGRGRTRSGLGLGIPHPPSQPAKLALALTCSPDNPQRGFSP